MSFLGLSFGQNAEVDIILDGQDERKMAEIKDENGRKERHYLFYDGESVTGKVHITLHRKTNKLEHQGIRIELVGQIELYYDRGNHHEFLSLVKQLAMPGELHQNTSFDFEFNKVEKPFECYTGANVRLRYFLRVTVVRRLTDMTKEMDLLVHTLATYPEMNNPIKMEVGIEECLHIEFEYNKSKYHLKDVIVGKIYFLLVRIKIKHMEVAIIKRETTGSGPNTFHDNETIAKYEIMDGAPVRGESIPIRVFLAGYDLTPTMKDINKKFSVKYYLNLVLVDEEERRYFKQQEITLWRKGERLRKGITASGSVNHVPHAMARHDPGEYPSQNVRTAPTPSDPHAPSLPMPTSVEEPELVSDNQNKSTVPTPSDPDALAEQPELVSDSQNANMTPTSSDPDALAEQPEPVSDSQNASMTPTSSEQPKVISDSQHESTAPTPSEPQVPVTMPTSVQQPELVSDSQNKSTVPTPSDPDALAEQPELVSDSQNANMTPTSSDPDALAEQPEPVSDSQNASMTPTSSEQPKVISDSQHESTAPTPSEPQVPVTMPTSVQQPELVSDSQNATSSLLCS